MVSVFYYKQELYMLINPILQIVRSYLTIILEEALFARKNIWRLDIPANTNVQDPMSLQKHHQRHANQLQTPVAL